MLIAQPYINLAEGKSKACMGCGIDQVAAPHTGGGDHRYFLIPDPETNEPWCPVCFFAKHWQTFAQELHGQIIFTETPQSVISLSFYFKQIASKASLEKTPNLVAYVTTMYNQIIESSNRAVRQHLPDMYDNLIGPNTAYLQMVTREIPLPHSLIQRMRYVPHSADFEILTFTNTPTEQLDMFLNATQFNQAMFEGGRSFIAQAINWYDKAQSEIHL